ncbi:unannotated protein [freshwater metagenome]|uniref:Unannotated protein n=1 Tax=freshwater metagenome TaxID=449393 RepID=A0A6J7AXD2_9ZZZZ
METKLGSNETIGAYFGSPEELEPTYFAPPSSIISAIARAEEISASDGSTPRSNRLEASEDNLCLRELLAIVIGSKRAASSAIWVVFPVTSEVAPPITPAKARAVLLSATTRSSELSLRSWLSKVLIVFVLPARLIINEVSIFMASKACKG